MIPYMGKKVIEILAENLARNCAPGYRFATIVELGARSGIGKSTVARIKNAETVAGIDKVEAIAGAYGLQAWQFLVPGMDVKSPPKIGYEGESQEQRELSMLFDGLKEPERQYLLAKARELTKEAQAIEKSKKSAPLKGAA